MRATFWKALSGFAGRRDATRQSALRRSTPHRRHLCCEPLEDRRLLSVIPYVVNSLADVVATDGVITLREALEAANTNVAVGDAHAGSSTETDLITFDPSLSGGTITLGGSQLDITDDLLLLGPGADHLTIDANQESRVFQVAADTEAILSGLTITGGSANYGGGIHNDGDLTVVNSTLSANSAHSSGGGIYSLGTLTMVGSTLSANSGRSFGGGIHTSGTLTVITSTLSGNSAWSGGGINNDSGTVTVANATLSGNSATYYGGGICSVGDLMVTNSTISGNSVDQHFGNGGSGGGINSAGTLTVTNSTISGNSLNYSYRPGLFFGGGICCRGTSSITNSTISNNMAENDGGGVHSDGTLTITDCTISRNSARWWGGGIFSTGDSTVTQSTISENSAVAGGGGIWNTGMLTVDKSSISGNSVNGLHGMHFFPGGGGIVNRGWLTITHSIISGNSALMWGGGICNCGPLLTVNDCTLSGNRANGAGSDSSFGGAVFLYEAAGPVTVTNSTLAGNVADYGGGLCERILDDLPDATTITSSVLAGNAATYEGGGISTVHALAIANSIVALNSAPSGTDVSGPLTPESQFNLIGVDPLFVRNPSPGADGTWGTADDDYGDLRLRSDSAAIDAGSNALLPPDGQDLDADGDTGEPLPIDLAGNPRVIYGTVDIGAYEYWLTGDLNEDRSVDGADLDIVRANWGQSVTARDWSHGEVSGDGFVGGADLDLIRANWGQSVLPPPAVTVAATVVNNTTEAQRVQAHDAVMARETQREPSNARAALVDLAWAYQWEQLRGPEQAGKTDGRLDRARDLVLSAYWM